MSEKLLYELSSPGRVGVKLPDLDVAESVLPEADLLRKEDAPLPEVSEHDAIRHFTRLSSLNHHVDKDFYPLGSCTMKYNPKINEVLSAMPEFARLHPFTPSASAQGALELMWKLGESLCKITGFEGVTLQPPAGASGELTGLMLMKSYHEDRGDTQRNRVIIPDSSHGTNPASINFAGCEIIEIKSAADGTLDPEAVREVADERLLGLMITNPNTLGIFEDKVLEVARIVHESGGLMYMDGANLNALMGIAKPAELGFDVMHFNLHKTFATPHGGGGPGSGPVCCTKELEPFLPSPIVDINDDGKYFMNWNRPESFGRVHGFHGNFLVLVRAYAYILANGGNGLARVSKAAIINANYLRVKLQKYYDLPHSDSCMHEAVFSADKQLKNGVKALDIAKRLLDFGMHAPTIYFPLIVHEAIMIEPTETETKEKLDEFIEIMKQISLEAEENPEILKSAPVNTPVGRLDEAMAARKPNLRYIPEEKG